MDILNNLMQGFAIAATPVNLLWALFGCSIGTAVGVGTLDVAIAIAVMTFLTLKLLPILKDKEND